MATVTKYMVPATSVTCLELLFFLQLMIHTLQLQYNTEEAREYLEILNKKYLKLQWFYKKHHNEPGVIESKNNMDNVSGWGLQTIYDDPTFPYHCDIDPHDETAEYFKDTLMVFGFFKRLKDLFINPYRSFLMNFPSNQYIGRWSPTKPLHGKIFLPIYSNTNFNLISYAESNINITLKVGQIYLIDMTENCGELRNDGDSSISFITFNIMPETFDYVLNLKGTV